MRTRYRNPRTRAQDCGGPLTSPSGFRPQDAVWSATDAAICVLTLIVSADLLGHMAGGASLVWMICYGLTLLRIALLWPHFAAALERNWGLFLFPLVCVASVLWSFDRPVTLVASLQLTMTCLIATYIGWRFSPAVLTRVVFVLLSLSVLASLLHGLSGALPWPAFDRDGALTGLFTQKNMLGQRALFAMLAALAICLSARRLGGLLSRPAALTSVALCLVAILWAQSVTSMILAPAFCGAMLLLCAPRLPVALSLPLAGIALIVLALAPVLLAISGVDPIGAVLSATGKDATLTGRTELWRVALDQAQSHPLLGVGYMAFWSAPEFLNERLATRHAGAITSTSFHNFALEARVAAGWPGLIALTLVPATAFWRLWHLFRATQDPYAAAGLVLLASSLTLALLTPALYRGHELLLILVLALGVSAGESLHRAVRAKTVAGGSSPRQIAPAMSKPAASG